MNCTIVVEQIDDDWNEITTDIFTFDEYSIATAIRLLLSNIDNVHRDSNIRTIKRKG